MSNKLLTFKEAAQQMRTTDSGLRWMVHQGTAPRSAKIGGRRMFRQSDIDAYIAAAFQERSSSLTSSDASKPPQTTKSSRSIRSVPRPTPTCPA
ncbi:helix-turn-helix transcriptional regulator [Microbacterium sp.]|uniref:helix-turn-helix transcriptional regulator n=1 Tax=Microbacterium sp. TaxID=51671 RepID=UPI00391B6D84